MGVASTLSEMILMVTDDPLLGAEIGVCRAVTSKGLLDTFLNLNLYLVDPWQEWPEDSSYRMKTRRIGDLSQEKWDAMYQDALANVSHCMDRVELLRFVSEEASKHVADSSLDFVFIDANHTYPFVLRDIKLWLPKVKSGGLISGHDYGGTQRGVKKAVHEMFPVEDLIVPHNPNKKRQDLVWGYIVD